MDILSIVVGVLITVLSGLILLFIEYRTGLFAKSRSSSRNKPVMTLRQRIANVLRLKPRLTISVRDISCYAIKVLRKGAFKDQVWVWQFVCLVEIKNKGKVAANNISSGAIKLSLKCKDNILALEIAPGTATKRFDLEKGQSAMYRIVFPREDVVKEHSEFYPDGSYRLEYTYSFIELSHTQKAVTKGRLAKVDWSEDAKDLIRAYFP